MEKIRVNTHEWGEFLTVSVTNTSDKPQQLRDVTVYETQHTYEPASSIYGEGFQLLSQYEGTIQSPSAVTDFSDAKHYRLVQPEGFHTVYNLLLVQVNPAHCDMYAFSSCRRFNGKICWNAERLQMRLDLEGLELAPGETLPLENLCIKKGVPGGEALKLLGGLLSANHPIRLPEERPAGWCSWYCFWSDVTQADIQNNVEVIQKELPQFSYIQVDDGYQTFMGDWLSVREDFGDLRELLRGVEQKGCKPAIWVAPFIAEKDSVLLREHPEYFVQDEHGRPLPSDTFTFGGWRKAPWYMLDGSHPGACEYLTHVFSVMRKELHIRYFKLDATCWGAFSNGVRHDRNATSVEAYRRGMDAIWAGAGEDALLLGCNAPMWPSVGAVNAMRVSGDLARYWPTVRDLHKETLHRSWMNKALWINDPDAFTLRNPPARKGLTEEEIRFHKTLVFAAGGMMLCGDDMSAYSAEDIRQASLFLKAPCEAPAFDCFDLSCVRLGTQEEGYLCLFNDRNEEKEMHIPLPGSRYVSDVWQPDQPAAYCDVIVRRLAPHDAAVLRVTV